MIHNKIIFLFIVNIYLINYVFGQKDSINDIKRNTVYFEFLGNSATISSVHYNWIFKKAKTHSYDLSLGFGYYPNKNNDLNPSYAFPISVNWSNGLKNHHLDLGFGLTYNSGVIQKRSYVHSKSMEALWLSFRLGYKYQKPNGGLFLRVGITPLLKLKEFSSISDSDNILLKFLPLFGIGIGITI